MTQTVCCLVTLSGGKRLSADDLGRISAELHDSLGGNPRIDKKYGRTGFTLDVRVVQEEPA